MADTIISAVRPRGWFWSEDAIFDLPVSIHAKLTLFYLKRCADTDGDAFPSLPTIGKAISSSPRSAWKAVEELVRHGVLDRRSGGGTGFSNRYTVKSCRLEGARTTRQGVSQEVQGGLAGGANEGIPKEGIHREGIPPLPPKGDPAVEILNFFNRKTGGHFQPLDGTLRLIRARLKEATEDQIRAVIVVRVRKWKDDTKMREFLTPKTIFRPSNFATYLGQLPATAFEADPDPQIAIAGG